MSTCGEQMLVGITSQACSFMASIPFLLFFVLLQMTGRLWRCALVAALFAVHPLHVESVAWISERKDVLSTLLGLLALWTYVAYARDSSKLRYSLVLALFILSLMAKAMWVTFPFLLLLLDIWPLQRWKLWPIESSTSDQLELQTFDTRRIVLEKIPLLGIAAIFCAVAIISQGDGHAIVVPRISRSEPAFPTLLSDTRYM